MNKAINTYTSMYNLIYCAYLIRYLLEVHPKKEQLLGSQIISRLFDIMWGGSFQLQGTQ